MRLLITGSRGTLGIPLSKELRDRGHEVYGCDLTHCADRHESRCDIREFRQLQLLFEAAEPQMVVHLAAEFGRMNGNDFFEQMWTTNVLGTRNVIDLCVQQNVPLIYASSSEAYGRLADEYGVLKEELLDTFAPRHHNEYALSKWVNERQVAIARERGLKAVGMRIFNVYGPGEHYNRYRSVVCQFIHASLTGEPVHVTQRAVRQLLYVDDFVRTAANIVGKFSACEGKNINIAHPESVTIEYLASLIGVVQNHLPDPHNVTCKVADITMAKQLLDHDPQVSIQEGVKRTQKWMAQWHETPHPPCW